MKKLRRYFRKFSSMLGLLLSTVLMAHQSTAQGIQTFSTAGTFTNGFTVPAGVTSIKVEAWGGGAGGSRSTLRGGGGGAFAGNNAIAVTPGATFTVVVGALGDANAGSNIGGNSSFGSVVIAAGANTATGGLASASTGAITFSGGSGGTNTSGNGGAGGGGSGGSGGPGGAGGNTTTNAAGAAGAAGAAAVGGSPGAAGGAGGNSTSSGTIGTAPGGGGGERGNSGNSSGTGAVGRVIITWTCPAATISYGSPGLCKSVTSAPVTITGSAGGTFSAPAGLTLNTATGVINPSTSTTGTYTVHYQIAGGGGCAAVDATTSVTINNVPISSVNSQTNVNCFGGNDGTITILGSNGTGPYNYSVDNGVNWTPAVPALPNPYVYPGLIANQAYRIRVRDNNGCISK